MTTQPHNKPTDHYKHAECDKAIVAERPEDACLACREHMWPNATGHIQAEGEKHGLHTPYCWGNDKVVCATPWICGRDADTEPTPPTPSSAGELEAILAAITPGEDEKGRKVYLEHGDYAQAIQAITQLYDQKFNAAIRPLPSWNKMTASSRWYALTQSNKEAGGAE